MAQPCAAKKLVQGLKGKSGSMKQISRSGEEMVLFLFCSSASSLKMGVLEQPKKKNRENQREKRREDPNLHKKKKRNKNQQLR